MVGLRIVAAHGRGEGSTQPAPWKLRLIFTHQTDAGAPRPSPSPGDRYESNKRKEGQKKEAFEDYE